MDQDGEVVDVYLQARRDGAGSVGVGAAVIAGAGGIVLAPVAIPVAILGH